MTFDAENQEISDIIDHMVDDMTVEVPTQTVSATARASRIDRFKDSFCATGLNTLFDASNESSLFESLEKSVFGQQRYQKLPRFARTYVEGYLDGSVDTLARIVGAKPVKTLKQEVCKHKVPRWVSSCQPSAIWHRHEYGGGWVADTASVEKTVYVGPTAVVYDHAAICGMVRIYGNARVGGAAEILDRVQIHGHAKVTGSPTLMGTVVLSGQCTLNLPIQLKEGIFTKPITRPPVVPLTPKPVSPLFGAEALENARKIFARVQHTSSQV